MGKEDDDYYSGIAPGYDELHGAEQDEKLAAFLRRVTLRRGARLLDVGCGTGRSAKMLVSVDWRGIDPSEGLIAQAPADVRARIKRGSAEEIPYGDASFEVVLSLTALQNFDDPLRGIQEMHRVIAPNGIMLLSFLKRSSKAARLDRAIRDSLKVLSSWEQEKDMMYICVK